MASCGRAVHDRPTVCRIEDRAVARAGELSVLVSDLTLLVGTDRRVGHEISALRGGPRTRRLSVVGELASPRPVGTLRSLGLWLRKSPPNPWSRRMIRQKFLRHPRKQSLPHLRHLTRRRRRRPQPWHRAAVTPIAAPSRINLLRGIPSSKTSSSVNYRFPSLCIRSPEDFGLVIPCAGVVAYTGIRSSYTPREVLFVKAMAWVRILVGAVWINGGVEKLLNADFPNSSPPASRRRLRLASPTLFPILYAELRDPPTRELSPNW